MPAANLKQDRHRRCNRIPRTDRKNRSIRWKWIALAFIGVVVSGCVQIPEESWTISYRSPFEIRRQPAECTLGGLDPAVSIRTEPGRITPGPGAGSTALNPGGFSLVNWNIFKGKKEGWAEDLRNFIRNADILILQEAYLTESLKSMLKQERYHWDMTAAFEYRQIEAGVLTAARTAPTFTCTFRETEPITRIPKSALITRYPFAGTQRELLVANIHAINFTMEPSAFKKQIDRLEGLLAAYRGPLIVSGDFNTWTTGRMSHVNAMAQRLDLSAVRFDENRRSRFFGREIDHVYYRGLEAENAATPIVSTSDHNPLTVVFKLAPARGN